MYDLYHPRIFELAADIPHLGRLGTPHGSATKVSKVCGSTVTVDVRLDRDTIVAFAIDVEACALGQAAAAVIAHNAIGGKTAEIMAARDALRAMLKENGPPPAGRFWELRHLEGVRDYPQRHTSTMLAFDAAVAAIEQATIAFSDEASESRQQNFRPS
jgi:NifU-like protein involved in Fe-S cluster formation